MLTSTEEIKARLNVVDVVSSSIRLHKAGANFKALCPFHTEKTPSFIVSPARQTWHCFGCNQGGDIFSFVMKMEGVEFYDALTSLAKKAGVEIRPQDRLTSTLRSKVVAITDQAAKFYEAELTKEPLVRKYLETERGIKLETIKDFRIGYAPNDWRMLLDHLVNIGFKTEDIERAGLIIRKSQVAGRNISGDSRLAISDKQYYDRFRGRIMFPIFDAQGQVIGFGGRIFQVTSDQEQVTKDNQVGELQNVAKYINTPETIAYSKSKVLYGLDRAKEDIRKTGVVVLVEGYTDVILSHQAGVKNVVAVSGTALSEAHLRRLRFLAETLLLSFDMDDAGLEAARRVVELATPFGFAVKVLALPSGQDPADVAQRSYEEWHKTLESSKHVVDFFLGSFAAILAPDTIESKRKVREKILPLIAPLPSAMERAHWVSRVADLLAIPENSVWQDLQKVKIPEEIGQKSVNIPAGVEPPTRLEKLDDYFLSLILWGEHVGLSYIPEGVSFNNQSLAKLWHQLKEGGLGKRPLPEIIQTLPEVSRNQVNALLLKAEVEVATLKDVREEIDRAQSELERVKTQRLLDDLSKSIKAAEKKGELEKRDELLKQFQVISRKLNIHV